MALTGSELLAKDKELGDASKSDSVRAAGYVSSKKDGGEQLSFTAFHEALLEAKGVSLGMNGGNGNLLFGMAFTGLLGLKPGDEFAIKLGKKQIRLIPAGTAEEE
ncbi:AbrB family transcriptional regulator [Cyanobium sp. Cruz CV13-4-11]|jgi:hypothetical protein|uniref:AbrB family transcriptional regulator n=1 Tax=unclassified Cyanobium TaxID=2627006 RepID=UPI0020CEA7A4|nr:MULTISPECIES: AbrB family transcriptional regulator [unclassified Cyanobium]MCP9902505.1 AbrB family transcriptional regulator [Cyanobium sp. Cruz CV11-17]MCP9921339.1 AbrB family transcriptional regulator [Cyanobium sp. Cruz CV13-4-11]